MRIIMHRRELSVFWLSCKNNDVYSISGSRVMSPTNLGGTIMAPGSGVHQHLPAVITKPKLLVSQPATVIMSAPTAINGPASTVHSQNLPNGSSSQDVRKEHGKSPVLITTNTSALSARLRAGKYRHPVKHVARRKNRSTAVSFAWDVAWMNCRIFLAAITLRTSSKPAACHGEVVLER